MGLLVVSHQLEVVNLLQFRDDELASHVGHFHLKLVNLDVVYFDHMSNVVHLILRGNPSAIVTRKVEPTRSERITLRSSTCQSTP